MSNKRRRPYRPRADGHAGGGDAIFKRRPSSVKARRRSDGLWELVHPPCALERAEDLEEVQAMIDGGETELAVDELRWLLEECRDFIEAHYLLGEIAFEARDFRLARGHFGYACELGWTALPTNRPFGTLSYSLPANQPLFHATKGLAGCLNELNKRKTALAVLNELLAWDASDPLGTASLKATWSQSPPRHD